MFIVYAIFNKEANKFYIGQTVDVNRRLTEHNEHVYKGYTSWFPGKWVLIYQESVATRQEALKREKQLKSGNGRLFVKSLIPE